MKVLGIDTSSYANAISVIEGDRIIADFNFETKTDSLEKIVTNIDFTLDKAGLTLEDIDGFGVGLGPGSWTGIRVGVTVGKILAFSTNKPVSGVSTLEVLANNARNIPVLICPIIHAGTRDTVYSGFYRMKNGSVTRVGEYYVGDIQKLLETVREPVVFLGSGARVYHDLIAQTLDPLSVYDKSIEEVPKGSTLALLAAARFEHGQSDNVLSLEPLYLKESTARALPGK